MTSNHPAWVLSQSLADAAERAGTSTVLVNGRGRFPASGFFYQSDLVLTADHVLERDEEITVVLPDGRELPAALAGRDPGSDLALLRVADAGGSPAVPAGSAARVGELVLALGRPGLSGFQASLGIVSAVQRAARTGRRRRGRSGENPAQDTIIYTDAVPYPGFSGGPLVNAAGEVLGLNTSGLVQGVSVAVPVARALQIAAVLAEHGGVRRGYLGVRSQLVPLDSTLQERLGREQDAGLLLVWVEPDSPAAQGGLIVGDLLTAIAGQPTADHEALQIALAGDVVGTAVEIELLRGGQKTTTLVTIGVRGS